MPQQREITDQDFKRALLTQLTQFNENLGALKTIAKWVPSIQLELVRITGQLDALVKKPR